MHTEDKGPGAVNRFHRVSNEIRATIEDHLLSMAYVWLKRVGAASGDTVYGGIYDTHFQE